MLKQKRIRFKGKYPIITVLVILVLAGLYIYNEFFLMNVAEGEMQIHYIDVGQGDSALVLSDFGSILIDAGTIKEGDKVASYVQYRTSSIDYMILSHPHEDHIGGADAVLSELTVKNIVMPDCVSDTTSFDRVLDHIEDKEINVIKAQAGTKFELGDISVEILSPGPAEDYSDTNDVSAIVRLEHGKNSFLFTGDAGHLPEKDLVQSGAYLRSDVLKAGHHGSSSSSSESFIDSVSPKIAVISCGKGNSYGHPHREVIKLFEERGIEIYRTDEMGNVIISSDGKDLTVK